MPHKLRLSLTAQIGLALVLGFIAGILLQHNTGFANDYIRPFGTIFLNLIKFIVCPLVLFSVMGGVVSMDDVKKVGVLGFKTLVVFFVTSAIAVAFAIFLSLAVKGVFPVLKAAAGSAPVAAPASVSVGDMLVGMVPANFVKPFADANMLQVIVMAILFAVSAVGCAFTPHGAVGPHALGWFRFIGGLAIGGVSVVVPLYIVEVSPGKYRGRLVAMNQFNIVFGILISYVSNYLIARFMPNADPKIVWRVMLGAECLPIFLFMGLLGTIPESPRWLVRMGRSDEAGRILGKIGYPDVTGTLHEIAESLKTAVGGMKVALFQRRYLKPILLAFFIAFFNQMSGINAINYYAPRIFQMIFGEGSELASLVGTIGMGVINLVFTALAFLVIDRFGRRVLIIGGSLGRALLPRVSDIMRKEFAKLPASSTVLECIVAMTVARAGACVLVNPDGSLAGVFTHGDFARAYQKDTEVGGRPVEELMTRNPIFVEAEKHAVAAVKILRERRIDDLVVLDAERRPVGLIDTQDLVRLKLI